MSNIKQFFEQENVKKRFTEMLGKRAPQFITSVLQIATSNKLLENVEPLSIYNSAAIAATLDLPLNSSLGKSWIVPYGGKAQFQIGWKGYVELALRTNQYKRINVVEVYESQFKSWNALTEELTADFTKDGTGNVVGYCAYFQLLNGFEKVVYWSKEKVMAHGKRFSKSFNSGPWKTDTEAMCKKTVLKHMLSQWGILSIEMQTALKVDQSAVSNPDTVDVDYIDSTDQQVNKEEERISLLIDDATSIEHLDKIYKDVPDSLLDKFLKKKEELSNGK